MAQTLAKITCPNCKQPFSAPLEQVLDVQLDPMAKSRLISGQVNLVVCPHCGAAGALGLPFIYHDSSKELALVFMPMNAGRNDMERQQLIGSLSRAVMNQLPPEQRKGYLLNPQVFFSYESLVTRVLEADGITREMIEAQRAKLELLKQLLEAPSFEARTALIREKEEMFDEEFFQLLYANLSEAEAMGREDLVQRMLEVRSLLFEQTALGSRMMRRAEALRALQQEPSREKLLELLLNSDDPDTRAALIVLGQPLVDYLFFQAITQQIEQSTSKEEQQRLESLRQEVLEVRDEMKAAAQQMVDSRLALLRDLLTMEKPELLIRRHLTELDDLFFDVLGAEIEQAERAGDAQTVSRLREIWQLTIGIMQQQVPPELRLLTRVLEAKDIEEIRALLEANRRLISQPFLELLEQAEQDLSRQGQDGLARRMAAARAEAAKMLGAPGEGETEGLLRA